MDNFFLLLLVLVFVIYLFIVQYCWNKTIAPISNTIQIDFYQTFLLVVLIGTMIHTPLFLTLDY